jgi:ribonuclease VapC
MIVVDSSALIAILEREDDAEVYAEAIVHADRILISAVNVHETDVVVRVRRGPAALERLWRLLLVDNDFEIAPFDVFQARAALSAFERYGKGLHWKAKLNLADCAAYALASATTSPRPISRVCPSRSSRPFPTPLRRAYLTACQHPGVPAFLRRRAFRARPCSRPIGAPLSPAR